MGNCGGGDADRRTGSSLNIRGGNNGKGGPNSRTKSSECKVLMLGDAYVGKTSVTMRYAKNEFKEGYNNTIGAQFQQPRITLKNGNILKLNLWDTAGEEKFRSMISMYYKEAKGVVIVYDIGRRETFENVKNWLVTLSEHIKMEDAILYLVGNKKDLSPSEKRVEAEMAKTFAQSNGMRFGEVSAKTGDGIKEVFNTLAEDLSKKFGY